ncbi:hypothetical protein [Actinoplanes friuliensis]|uniref:Lipoprotein n=1 Tax=Actinoplanes friuliensis DSM 7358 TaxID=1246995 RepID=U5VWN8_9ACTN|nr:hypothetical protein [Actinoplanes friuliensis]AGZ41289.1 hypothetical protein AFR_15035 [Actinoplanes friuliensis DSM 7358]
MPASRRLLAGALAAVLVSGAGCSLFGEGDRTATFHDGGAAPTTVTVPAEAGEPRISALPAAAPATLPPGTRALASPVEVETPRALEGTATITMTYDPAAVPDPAELAVYTFVEDLGIWLPAGNTLDTGKHTVSASTEHFSRWMLAVTDPDRLRYDQSVTERLKRTTGGSIVSLMYGEPRALGCDAGRVLVPAAVRSDLIVGPAKLCQQIMDDGSYELEWINNTELPIVFDLPAGFTETTTDYRLNPMLQGVLQQHRRPGGAIVLPDRSLKVAFGAGEDAEIRGELDWSIYFIALMRQIVEIAMLDESTDNPQARKKLDAAFEGAGWADCAGVGVNEWNDSHDVAKAVRKAVWDCKDKIARLVLDTFVKVGKGAFDSLKKFFGKRLDVLLGLDKLMAFARSEIAGLLALPGALTGALDTTVTVRPGRVMTYDDAMRLPEARLFDDTIPCNPLPSGVWPPPGLPAGRICVQAVKLDLDGNGRPDRLLTWRPPSPGPGIDVDAKRTGAAAYLDDGTFHQLETPVARWPGIEGVDLFDVAAVVHLGPDPRAQALVATGLGSSTLHQAILAVGTDRRLRPVTLNDAVADIASGGAAAYGSAWGCALSRKKPIFVQTYWSNDVTNPRARREWFRSFFTYAEGRLTEIGGDKGTIAPTKLPVTGSNCATAAVARRGPEIKLR